MNRIFSPVCSVFLIAILFISGCSPSQTYDVRGRVVGFGDDGRTVIVEHEDVPGLMPSMTMPFKSRDSLELSGLQAGYAIVFKLTLAGDSSWIHDVHRLSVDDLKIQPAGGRESEPADSSATTIRIAGDPAPEVVLIDEQDREVSLSDYRGKTLLLTFIYTRCPIPDYCPLMSRQFAQLQPVFKERFAGKAALLSVSFDTTYDTPAVLSEYARRQHADPSVWRFATGSPDQIGALTSQMGVFSEQKGQTFDHSLATILIGPDGRIAEIWRGNRWTTDEVIAAVERVNQTPESL